MVIQIIVAMVLFQICLYPYYIPILQKVQAGEFGIVRLLLLIAIAFVQAMVLASIANGFKKRIRATEGINRLGLFGRACGLFLLDFIICSVALSLFLNKWPNFTIWKLTTSAPLSILLIYLAFRIALVAAAFAFGLRVWAGQADDKLDNENDYLKGMVKRCKSKAKLYSWLKKANAEGFRKFIVNRITELVLARDDAANTVRTEFLGYLDSEIRKMLLVRVSRVKPKLMQEIAESGNDPQLAGEMAALAGDWKRLRDMFENGSLDNNRNNAELMISALRNNLSDENLRTLLSAKNVPLEAKRHMIRKQKEDTCKSLFAEYTDLRLDIIAQINDQKFLTAVALDKNESAQLRFAAAARIKANPALYELIAGSDVRDIRVAAARKMKEKFFFSKIFENIKDAEVLDIIVGKINDPVLLESAIEQGVRVPDEIMENARAKEKETREKAEVKKWKSSGNCSNCGTAIVGKSQFINLMAAKHGININLATMNVVISGAYGSYDSMQKAQQEMQAILITEEKKKAVICNSCSKVYCVGCIITTAPNHSNGGKACPSCGGSFREKQ